MTLSEKAAYIQGLADGLDLDETNVGGSTPNTLPL